MRLLSSLTNRIFLASAALTVAAIGIAAWVVNVRVTASADDELRRSLLQAGDVVDQQLVTVSGLFGTVARIVADLPKLKAAVATEDPPTVQPIAADYQRRVGSDLFLVTDRTGRRLALVAHGAQPELESLPGGGGLDGQEATFFWPRPGGILYVVTVPITAGSAPPEIVGSLSLGYLLDHALAERFRGLTGSEVAFAAGGGIRASTLRPEAWPALDRALGEGAVSALAVGGDEYLALARPLAPPEGSSLFGTRVGAPLLGGEDASPRPVALVLRSRTERLRFLRPIQAALLGTGLVAVLVATLVSYGLARTVTRPLGQLTRAMREMSETGDVTQHVSVPAGRWHDEDAALLARTFNTLTGSIARFQREASDRERLSALGRLSTVIAHEVRNPLMIIRASLRPLAAGAPSAAEVREAAADIGGEVDRLNRLVGEVLDFARPVRFELGPADLNELCEQAAAAATAGKPGCRVRLALDRSLPPLLTDAERLRGVVVNLLLNACHAVQALEETGPAGMTAAGGRAAAAPREDWAPLERGAIELRTSSGPPETVVLSVRDAGVGIDPADLPRVFEPYFTTRRTGSGLGLAIARNVVQGLGGEIRVSSKPGGGTQVSVHLPLRPPPDPGARAGEKEGP